MTAPRTFYLKLNGGATKLLSVRTLGELQDIVLAHYPIGVPNGGTVLELTCARVWKGEIIPLLKEVWA